MARSTDKSGAGAGEGSMANPDAGADAGAMANPDAGADAGAAPAVAAGGAGSSMYETALDETRELFGDFLEGARTAPVCVLSGQRLAQPARAALDSSMNALGYGPEACAFAALSIEGGAALDRQALFLLLEGLDPICLIAEDAAAARALEETYRCEVVPGKAQHVFGRPCVAFESFEEMLKDDHDKQLAWALLKRLPRYGERR